MVKRRIIDSVTSIDPKSARWRSLCASARMAWQNGEFRQAANLLTRAMELAKIIPDHSFAVSATEFGLGAARLGMGQLREAEDLFQRVMNKLSSSPDANDRELYAATLRQYADLLRTKGDERSAEKELQKSISILEDLGPNSAIQLAYSLSDLCGLYVLMGRLSEASKYITSAMEILESVFGPENPELIQASLIYQLSMSTSNDELYTATEEGLIKMEYQFSQHHPNLVRAICSYIKVLKERGEDKRLEEVRERFGSFEKNLARKVPESF